MRLLVFYGWVRFCFRIEVLTLPCCIHFHHCEWKKINCISGVKSFRGQFLQVAHRIREACQADFTAVCGKGKALAGQKSPQQPLPCCPALVGLNKEAKTSGKVSCSSLEGIPRVSGLSSGLLKGDVAVHLGLVCGALWADWVGWGALGDFAVPSPS